MMAARRVAVLGGVLLGGVALVALGVVFVAVGLDKASEISGVIGAVVGVAGLGLSGYGIVLARRWVSPRLHGGPPTISLADSHRPGSGDMKPGLALGVRLALSLVPRLACGAAAASPSTGKPFRRAVEVAVPLAGD
jgi:hypothetical protein